MNKTVILRFNKWTDPDHKEPFQRTITFRYDGQFVSNSETDKQVPMTEEAFDKIIKVYVDNCNAEVIDPCENNQTNA